MAVEKYKLGSTTSVLTTELNSLANNANAITSSPYNNTQSGGTGDGYTLGDIELTVSFGTAPTASTGVSVWFLQTLDGTNYEDGSSSITPARVPDVVIPVRAVTGVQRITRRVPLPNGNFHVLVRNDATGQAFAASGNTLKIRSSTYEGV